MSAEREALAAAIILHRHPTANALTRPDDALVMVQTDPDFFVCRNALDLADAVLAHQQERAGVALTSIERSRLMGAGAGEQTRVAAVERIIADRERAGTTATEWAVRCEVPDPEPLHSPTVDHRVASEEIAYAAVRNGVPLRASGHRVMRRQVSEWTPVEDGTQ